MLAKGLDSPQPLASRCQLPIDKKLLLVLGRPLDRQTQRARWKPPIQDLKPPNRDLDLELAIDSMEMGRVMILEVHSDNDTEES
jgi:hypothetical protein